MTAPAYIGIDLGGTAIKAALTDQQGALLAFHHVNTESQSGREALMARLAALVEQMRNELASTHPSATIKAIGLSVPGVIDAVNGQVEFTVALTPEWNGFAAAAAIERITGLPTILANDAQAAAVGEQQSGGGRGFRDFICITVGTGIGGGVVIDGELYAGSRGMSGVFGHMTVVPDGPRCGCGNLGCLEVLASGTAITRAAREKGISADGGAPPTPEMLARMAEAGDQSARDIFRRAGRYIGVAAGNMVCALNPEAVVIGGGVSLAGDVLLEPIRSEIKRRTVVFSPERGGVSVIQSPLAGRAGAVGTAALAAKGVANRE